MKTILSILLAYAVIVLTVSVALAQPKKPARVTMVTTQKATCQDVGGSVQVCTIRDSAGHEIKCTMVGGICIQ